MADQGVETLITHSGSFHADDLLAFAVLSALHPDASLLRTRDPQVIAAAEGRAIVFDVGFRYAPERHLYDHHQPDRPRRPEGLAYSSFGLIWQHFGRAFIAAVLGGQDSASPDIMDMIHAEMDAGLVRDIDAVDNGELGEDQRALMHPLSLPGLLMWFRPAFDDERAGRDDLAFLEAASVARQILRAQVDSTAARLRSNAIVAAAIAGRSHPNWIELPRSMDYLGPILAADPASGAARIQYVVAPSRDEWQLNTVNVALDSFQSRKPLPDRWAGLRGPDFAAVTGVPDAVFCHAGRFIAIARSRDGVMELLRQALED
ncbi:MYG1 family protein [Rubellimicrobium arenae]|uniref:MYG1 family protein n=1 Tax=Rubellimicrobium arenae TaxID=2817372 RepID=UPI001B30C66C|nr:MYG1 family protein [Rubellimicrobium arenae]